ncbi:N-formylglutamate amidohydrolase [Candidatus Woesearchaeota archaeon]|nr:N-formylglutamate amidohydrolase [Candidatus Woesearchaeota archaeon]MBT5271855.1 N-formylglutamate amidohydrolase [Candidatus Woesearchaeota archaeon]MBT6041681.1 N-formylglutamate amidohydrolase [Candidatus Woesearchaeota archaeon]MBT6337343.1 N-formylglutamate amidohydrolase [Candidatus Woesearchaeota archaeon]MBT7927591.1 N-formylglutamate amidohydrolase [Candidatus Woesearchaeota archaeon]
MKKLIKDNLKLFYNVLVFSKRTLSLRDRFFLFRHLDRIWGKVCETPHLNFLSQLTDYKLIGDVLDGDVEHFYKSRNRLWFKNYFEDRDLYEIIKQDIEKLYPKYKEIKLTITHKGIIVFDNYKPNKFNSLLLTIHNGTWIDKEIKKNMAMPDKKRLTEEDLGSGMLYAMTVLEEGGIWIDCKQSRFMCDFNRSYAKAIYANNQEKMLRSVWKEELNEQQKEIILDSYRHFYYILSRLISSYRFNIIFDGHSMRDKDNRPEISFGTKYVPAFYMPIVQAFRQRLKKLDYKDVRINDPYKGGYILKFLTSKFPNVFIFSMEVNKKLYMRADETTIVKSKVDKISQDIIKMLKIEADENGEVK